MRSALLRIGASKNSGVERGDRQSRSNGDAGPLLVEGVNLHRLQICVRCWVPENSQHRDNLPFVVKRVGYDVQQDKSWTPEFAAPIHRALCQGRVKLLFRKIAQIAPGRFSDSLLSG